MFMAVVAMLASCSDNEEKSFLNQIQVSQSYIPLPAGEESDPADKQFQAEITLSAVGDWQFKAAMEKRGLTESSRTFPSG